MDVCQTSDGRPTEIRRPTNVRQTSAGRPTGVRWTSDARPMNVRWTFEGGGGCGGSKYPRRKKKKRSDGRLIDIRRTCDERLTDVRRTSDVRRVDACGQRCLVRGALGNGGRTDGSDERCALCALFDPGVTLMSQLLYSRNERYS